MVCERHISVNLANKSRPGVVFSAGKTTQNQRRPTMLNIFEAALLGTVMLGIWTAWLLA